MKTATSLPDSGIYAVVSSLDRCRSVRVGSLGTYSFPGGTYVYVGRSKRNLPARIARHRRARKRLHWHIDYFLQHARVVRVETFPFSEDGECRAADYFRTAEGVAVVVDRFGASDCGCPSHLFFLGESPRVALHEKRLRELIDR